ncbi:hypothetical protein E0H26_06500 [Micromonospora zingiberis]|uniref:Uncharacterized protein n=1 Tax=Micromonospora zingiberis TaxID=2053011 RepID=A0A4R0GTM9_9ACTN|nr:hypothetical protein E0H26_06500 [Micromonospora zingiberis]
MTGRRDRRAGIAGPGRWGGRRRGRRRPVLDRRRARRRAGHGRVRRLRAWCGRVGWLPTGSADGRGRFVGRRMRRTCRGWLVGHEPSSATAG